MLSRIEEKKKAIQLRKQGKSFNEIAKQLGVSKGSLSIWLRPVHLTARQKENLSRRGHTLEAIERRRAVRLLNERKKRLPIFIAATNSIHSISSRDLFILGTALYWGEGTKRPRGTVSFINGDPRLIQIMTRFFIEICGISKSKLRGHVLLHHHLNPRRAERYWQKVSGIPLQQFQKTSLQHNRKSKGKRDCLPHGVFAVSVYNVNLYLQVMGWMEGVYKNLISRRNYIESSHHAFL